MKLYKPKFWDKNIGFFSIVLAPLGLITSFVVFLKKNFTKKIKFEIPIICVGNIYIGGTGKTPTAILIAKELKARGKKPVIVRKYYKNHQDEYNLINHNLKNIIFKNDRIRAIDEAIKKGFDIIILDDGFQDYRIEKIMSIICFNSNQLIGNGLIFPAGPLRENLNSLRKAQIVIINGKKNKNFENKIKYINKNLFIFYSNYKPENKINKRNKNFFALAGIGNPGNFFEILRKNKFVVKKEISFPDHYQFSKFELKKIIDEAKGKNSQVIMTEKDFFRIKDYKINKIKHLKVNLEIKNKKNFFDIILKKI